MINIKKISSIELFSLYIKMNINNEQNCENIPVNKRDSTNSMKFVNNKVTVCFDVSKGEVLIPLDDKHAQFIRVDEHMNNGIKDYYHNTIDKVNGDKTCFIQALNLKKQNLLTECNRYIQKNKVIN
jgi:hypothetical protein